jgi:hypothetical protein
MDLPFYPFGGTLASSWQHRLLTHDVHCHAQLILDIIWASGLKNGFRLDPIKTCLQLLNSELEG